MAENITFRMLDGRTMAMRNGIRMKKGVSGPSTQESLSQNRWSQNQTRLLTQPHDRRFRLANYILTAWLFLIF